MKASRRVPGLENGVMDYHAEVLAHLLLGEPEGCGNGDRAVTLSGEVDRMSISLHRFGRIIEEMKRAAFGASEFKGVAEELLRNLVTELAALKCNSLSSGRKDTGEFAAAAIAFVQYVMEHSLLRDVRVVNILDNANCTVQTVLEMPGIEDDDSLHTMTQLLGQPKQLLD